MLNINLLLQVSYTLGLIQSWQDAFNQLSRHSLLPNQTLKFFDQAMTNQHNLTLAKKQIGSTREQRQIWSYRVKPANRDWAVKSILVTSLIHAKEIYSLNIAVMALLRLAFNHSRGQVTALGQFDIIFVPVLNPDGAEYFVKNDFFPVRKNRANQGGSCRIHDKGVDLNRNFDFAFGMSVNSSEPCGQQFRGAFPFSQPQTLAVKRLVESEKIVMHLDIHTYGNMLIIPPSIGQKTRQQIIPELASIYQQLSRISPVTIGSAFQLLNYQADGVFMDWMLSQHIFSVTYQAGDDFIQGHFQNDSKISISVLDTFFSLAIDKPLQGTKTIEGQRIHFLFIRNNSFAKTTVRFVGLFPQDNPLYQLKPFKQNLSSLQPYQNQTIQLFYGDKLILQTRHRSSQISLANQNWSVKIKSAESYSQFRIQNWLLGLLAVGSLLAAVLIRRIRENSRSRFISYKSPLQQNVSNIFT